jgi:hypothetical protein
MPTLKFKNEVLLMIKTALEIRGTAWVRRNEEFCTDDAKFSHRISVHTQGVGRSRRLGRGAVACAQVQPSGGLQSGLGGRQAMIEASEQAYCEAAVVMEALDASRRAE